MNDFASCPSCSYFAAHEGRLCPQHEPKDAPPVVRTRREGALATLKRWLGLLALALLLPSLAAAAVPTVAVNGNQLQPDGVAPASGTIACTLSQAGSVLDGATSQRVASQAVGTIGAGGAVTLSIVPNDVITPVGTAYTCLFSTRLSTGRPFTWSETWQVPSTPNPINIGAIPRLNVIPGVALTQSAALLSGALPAVVDAGNATVTAAGSTNPRAEKDRWADVANVKDFGASGSAQTTTGSINSGSNELTVASAIDFQVGQGISVAGAGAAGARLVTSITAINGLILTLAANAGTTVVAQAVKHNDGAAIQAAINSYAAPGAPVYLPPGRYRITAPGLMLRTGTKLIGSGSGWAWTGDFTKDVTVLDALDETAAGAVISTPTQSVGAGIENLSIVGPRGPTSFDGILLGLGAQYYTIRNVNIDGVGYGITTANGGSRGWIENVRINLTWRDGLRIGGSNAITVLNSFIANAGASNSPNDAAIHVTGASNDIALLLRDVDECQAGSSTIRIEDANRVLIDGPLIYSTANGYGIRVDSPSTKVTIRKVLIKPFSTGAPLWSVSLAGSGHSLEDVVTQEPNGGGAINDGATETIYANVNGKWKAPSTDASGTPGNATINKASGKVAIAAGTAAVIVTNSLVSAASIIHVTIQTADATLTFIKSVVPGAGTFTITGNANATAATTVAFTVQN